MTCYSPLESRLSFSILIGTVKDTSDLEDLEDFADLGVGREENKLFAELAYFL